MQCKFISLISILLLSISSVFAQWQDNASYNLIAPVDTPLFLSGNFAELRGHHFHAGLDFKTKGREGLPVYAPADGYVSRIKISTSGYGHALYIDHPDLKITTVYGHLKSFIEPLDKLAKDKHYEEEAYNIDFFLDSDAVSVKKGQIIAYSGNTGSSGGPHLHFEIRDRETQDPLNPLSFGFDVQDTKSPSVNGLRVYPVDGVVNGVDEGSKYFATSSYGDKYHLKGQPTINVWGKLGFSVSTIDYLDGSWNKCGIYSIVLAVDSQDIYEQRMDRVSYSEMRYIDAHLDQDVRRASHVDYQYSFKAKANNPLSIYKNIEHDGVVDFSDGKKHTVTYTIKDTHGNASVLTFNVHSVKPTTAVVEHEDVKLSKWDQSYNVSNNDFKLYVPARAMYEDQAIAYSVERDTAHLSNAIVLDNDHNFFNKQATLKIRPHKSVVVPISKMVICSVGKTGKLSPLPSVIEDTVLSSKIYNLGTFVVSCDTVAPTLKPVSIYNNKKFTEESTFGFKVADDFTGFWDYTATIDGEWALFYYEYKKRYVYYTIDASRLEKGKMHDLNFKAWDACDNIVEYNCQFFW